MKKIYKIILCIIAVVVFLAVIILIISTQVKPNINVLCNLETEEGIGKTIILVKYPNRYHTLNYSLYSTDGFYIYYNCETITGTDAGTFQVLTNKEIAKDKNHVYDKGEIIPQADPKTYELINDSSGYPAWDFGKDTKNIYLGVIILNNFDINTFQVLDADMEIAMVRDRNGTRYLDSNGDISNTPPGNLKD